MIRNGNAEPGVLRPAAIKARCSECGRGASERVASISVCPVHAFLARKYRWVRWADVEEAKMNPEIPARAMRPEEMPA